MTKPAYHHGTLRQALVEAATDLIAAEGAAHFTLARAARQTGVTPAAVYRHFSGRDALLAEVARQGHERLALLTGAAANTADPGAAILDYGEAYLLFADRFPGQFAAIRCADLPADQTPALAAAAAQSAAVLDRLAARLCAQHPGVRSGDVAAHLHALCLGIALGGPDAAVPALRAGLATYIAGLGPVTQDT
ncbi:MAG: TetR/AcrR family transcriptional regulator [Pseudomonadota bacterium]